MIKTGFYDKCACKQSTRSLLYSHFFTLHTKVHLHPVDIFLTRGALQPQGNAD